VTVQRQLTSAVTERYADAFVGSAMEHGTTIIQFDLRQHDLHSAWGPQAPIWWRQDSYHIDVQARSTFHHPMPSRCLVAQGVSMHDHGQRR
jgi:hypothetical protein